MTAEKVAINFFFERMNVFVTTTNDHDIMVKDIQLVDNAYWVINFIKGWVIVSANDGMVPVLGYNFKGRFPEKEQRNDNFKNFMQHFADQILYLKDNNIESEDYTARWNKYLTDDPQHLLNNTKWDQVGPLLTCTWHQNFPYNFNCPEDSAGPGGHTWAGCGATAMAQIMSYWRYPVHGSGSYTYYCDPYGEQTANFEEATYEWDAMQDNINFDNPWEIAEITYHAAVSLNMQFGPDGSSSNISLLPNAISTYFNYDDSAALFLRVSFPQKEWENMIREDLDLLRPVRYRGKSSRGGHAMVCDGYQDFGFFHFNFGWSGNANGYYTLDNLNGYNSNQKMVKNIFPADPDYPYIASGPDTLSFLSGSFTDGSGPAEDYPINMNASWLINPQSETDSVSNITLTFVQFNTDSNDYLRVYDGETTSSELLGEFSGDEIPDVITSTGNKLLITFSSTETGNGFRIEYYTTIPDYCELHQYFTEASGTINDGSGTFYYNNSTTCIYTIEYPSALRYSLEFTSFSTELDNDMVKIYDNDGLAGEFSGDELPEILELETNKIIVTWNTNEFIRDEGWSFDYSVVEFVGIDEKVIANNLSVFPNPTGGISDIRYQIKPAPTKEGDIRFVLLEVFDIHGQKIRKIVNEEQDAGEYIVHLDGSGLPAGIYLVRLQAGDVVETAKVLLIK